MDDEDDLFRIQKDFAIGEFRMIIAEVSTKRFDWEGQNYTVKIFNDFDCEFCGQNYDQDQLHMAVFLYGIFFLEATDLQYAGFTCPKCLNSNLINITGRLSEFNNQFSIFNSPDGTGLPIDLRYYAPAIHLPYVNCIIEGFSCVPMYTPLYDTNKSNFHGCLEQVILEEPNLEKEFLCSYVWSSSPPMGSFASVYWYRPDEVELLVKLENDCKVKIFPRYYFNNTFHTELDKFCWDYYLVDESSEITGYNFRLSNTVPDEKNFSLPSRFLKILTTEYYPNDFPFPDLDRLESLWKIDTPFESLGIQQTWSETDFIRFKRPISNKERLKMIAELDSLSGKSYVNEYLERNHSKFIHDFIELAARTDFSYGSFRDLQMEHLKKLYDYAHGESLNEEEYAIFPEGDTWTIIFEGRALRGLKGSGFKYIYRILDNPGKQFYTVDLDITASDTYKEKKPNDFFIESDAIQAVPDIELDLLEKGQLVGRTYYENAQKIITELEAEKQDSVKRQDKNRILEIEKLQSEIDSEVEKYKNHKKSKFVSVNRTKINRISQAIRRALLEIRGDKTDDQYLFRKKIYDHFITEMKPIKSYQQVYRNMDKIKWKLR